MRTLFAIFQNKKEKKEKIFFEIRLHTVGRGEKLKLS
jgi:hypothetical protein